MREITEAVVASPVLELLAQALADKENIVRRDRNVAPVIEAM